MVASEPNETLSANRRSAGCCTQGLLHPSSASCMLQESEPAPLSLAHLGRLSTRRHAKSSSSATRGAIRPTVSQQLGPNNGINERKENEKKGGYQWQRSYLLQQAMP